jgi:predicted transcriptional regulator
VKKRNVTISLPEDLLKRLKVLAALRDTSVTELIRRAAAQAANECESYEEARDAMMTAIRRARDLGTKGRIAWSRESLHDREALR